MQLGKHHDAKGERQQALAYFAEGVINFSSNPMTEDEKCLKLVAGLLARTADCEFQDAHFDSALTALGFAMHICAQVNDSSEQDLIIHEINSVLDLSRRIFSKTSDRDDLGVIELFLLAINTSEKTKRNLKNPDIELLEQKFAEQAAEQAKENLPPRFMKFYAELMGVSPSQTRKFEAFQLLQKMTQLLLQIHAHERARAMLHIELRVYLKVTANLRALIALAKVEAGVFTWRAEKEKKDFPLSQSQELIWVRSSSTNALLEDTAKDKSGLQSASQLNTSPRPQQVQPQQ